jgi:hypothetical protein
MALAVTGFARNAANVFGKYFDNGPRENPQVCPQKKRPVPLLPLAFASANHTFRTITLEGFGGDENQQNLVRSSGDATMWVAIEVNLALWGMILCAAVQAAERFAIY